MNVLVALAHNVMWLYVCCACAVSMFGTIAQNTCYHSFFLLFTNFNIYFCNFIRFVQILIIIFVEEIRK